MDNEALEIIQKIKNAMDCLLRNDKFLITNDTNERTITHKLAEYLQQEFSEWNVDCEYNRHGEEIKKIDIPKDGINWDDIEQRTVFPDIIVHKRNTNKNIVIIEVKKSTNSISRAFDENKLKAFTTDPYNYKFGFFLLINVVNGPYELDLFRNGREIPI
ncbi:MAG: hypothetical protein AB1480_00525 [Nitrospirota bacterium]